MKHAVATGLCLLGVALLVLPALTAVANDAKGSLLCGAFVCLSAAMIIEVG